MRNVQHLYRIISFEYLVEILEKKQLYFSSPYSWDDPFETQLKHPYSNQIYAQCWCSKGVSDAMWRIYSPDRLGVRIKTTHEKLKYQLEKATAGKKSKFKIKSVSYIPESELINLTESIADDLYQKFQIAKAIEPLFHKRLAFKHEYEVRAVIYSTEKIAADLSLGINLDINPDDFIETVLIDPRANETYVRAFKYYLKEKLNFKGRVEKSQLYSQPNLIEII